MQLIITKIRLLAVLALAGFIVFSIFEKALLAKILGVISLISFAIIVALHIKNYVTKGVHINIETEEEETSTQL